MVGRKQVETYENQNQKGAREIDAGENGNWSRRARKCRNSERREQRTKNVGTENVRTENVGNE